MSHCADFYVVEVFGGTPSGPSGSQSNPLTGSGAIQDAIDRASSGDTIHVAEGTYDRIVLPPYEDPPIDLTITGDNWNGGAADPPIIDGSGTSSVAGVTINGGQTADTLFHGFIIQDFSGIVACGMRIMGDSTTQIGSSPVISRCTFRNNSTNPNGGYGGAGMQILHDCDPLIVECTFEDNVIADTSVGYGGAIWIYGAATGASDCDGDLEEEPGPEPGSPPDPIILDCDFTDNLATNHANGAGGAIAITCGRGQILDSRFHDNIAADKGGAIYGHLCDGTLIQGCVFGADSTGNTADWGGGIYLQGKPAEDGVFERVHIIGNVFQYNVAEGAGGAIYVEDKNVTISHNVFEGNSAPETGAALLFGSKRTSSYPFVAYIVCNLFGPDNSVSADPDESSVIQIEQDDSSNSGVVQALFTNNTVAGNTDVKAITIFRQNPSYGMDFYCFNSIIWGNSEADDDNSIRLVETYPISMTVGYTNAFQEVFAGTGNISTSPGFQASDDFRLSGGSDCADTGLNTHWSTATNNDATIPASDDVEEDTRIQNTTIDMGCYEGED